MKTRHFFMFVVFLGGILLSACDKIETLTVKTLKGTVTSISKDIKLNWATLKIYLGNEVALWEFNNLPISEGTVLTLDNGNGQWDTIISILMKQQMYFIQLDGEASEGDLTFIITLENGFHVDGTL